MILDGKIVAKKLKEDIKQRIAKAGVKPQLAILMPLMSKDSVSYFKARKKVADELGVELIPFSFETNVTNDEVISVINSLNHKESCWGIMIDRPLPESLDEDLIFSSINPNKDVDGCNQINAGLLLQQKDCLVSCTAQAVVDLLKYYHIEIAGKKVVVIGRSRTVGLPVAQLFIKENATVTVCHSKTVDLRKETLNADIVVVAMGKAEYITDEYVSEHTTIIDVGINIDKEGRLLGDVKESAKEKCANYSPVPGGVGPLTSVELFKNLLKFKEML